MNDAVFAAEVNENAIYLDVKQYLANQRQGTHKTKERAEVARSTRKIKKQKGDRGARAGSIKSPDIHRWWYRVWSPSARLRFQTEQKAEKGGPCLRTFGQSPRRKLVGRGRFQPERSQNQRFHPDTQEF